MFNRFVGRADLTLCFNRILLAAAICVGIVGSAHAAGHVEPLAQETGLVDGWVFELTPFVWASGVEGHIGVGSELTWRVYGGVRYRVSKTVHLEAGYRYMSIEC